MLESFVSITQLQKKNKKKHKKNIQIYIKKKINKNKKMLIETNLKKIQYCIDPTKRNGSMIKLIYTTTIT